MRIRVLCLWCAVLAASPTFADTLTIDASKPGTPINPRMYGVFLEEINHGVDGGLYAEMIQNRGFEDAKAPEGFTYQQGGRGRGSGFRGADSAGGRWVNPGGYATTFVYQADKDLPFWSLVTTSGAQGVMSLDLADPMSKESPRSCKLEIIDPKERGRVGIANDGFWGISIVKGESYNLSFWAKPDDRFHGRVMATLENAATGDETVDIATSTITPGWKQYTATLTAKATDPNAKLVLSTSDRGAIWFDMVSLFPAKTFKGRPNGLRQDIAQMIADMKPGFVRFPGGCVVEGATVENVYNWKNTLGAVEKRPEMWNTWDYRRTHGMGFYEYLQFIEDIGAQPMFVNFAGQTCIYRQPEVVPMNQMQPIVQSYLDVMEYCNGSADSTWGKLRAEAGHPAPFNLNMIEIGNENTGQVYAERYAMIFAALKQKYPDVHTIANERQRQNTEMIDEHHYSSPAWFLANNHLYDKADRRVPIYLGEVAVTTDEGGKDRGNLGAALAEGVFLLGTERNADVVKMVSYAPLLANVSGRTALAGSPPPWHGMIYFDSTRVFGTASYYLWKTFGNNVPTYNYTTTLVSDDKNADRITGNIGVGTWGDVSAEYREIKVEKDGKVLYASDFTTAAEGWKTDGGRWAVQDGAYRQSGRATGLSYVGDENWSDYTLTMKARKISGTEGFLIVFGHKGGDKYWWNLGGWGNAEHGIEMNQTAVGAHARGMIETNRWYDIKIEVSGLRIRCFLDGVLITEATGSAPEHLFTTAGRDEKTGDLIIKAINPTATAATISLNITGDNNLAPDADITVLKSQGPRDTNSLEYPAIVVPVSGVIHNVSNSFPHEFPPYSLTVLRLKKK